MGAMGWNSILRAAKTKTVSDGRSLSGFFSKGLRARGRSGEVIGMHVPDTNFNDGICPQCGHRNPHRLGFITCAACSKVFAREDLGKNIAKMSRRVWAVAILGGLILGGVMVLFALIVDPFFTD